jgi:transcriptional regulator with XRE-family HTH domain
VAEVSFADRLRALREARGFSQYELAKRSGLSKQTLSRLEMDTVPSWPTVQALARALGVSCEAFQDEAPAPAKKGKGKKS